ncbi:MAG: cation transporting ATPase C-terminal domain-containing protein [Pseudomonadota bacterium]
MLFSYQKPLIFSSANWDNMGRKGRKSSYLGCLPGHSMPESLAWAICKMAVVAVQWPPLARLFHTIPLAWMDWLYANLVSLLLIPEVETAKWLIRVARGKR